MLSLIRCKGVQEGARLKRAIIPAGLAAGFDKDAQAMEPLLGLGLGFVEIGAPSRTIAPLVLLFPLNGRAGVNGGTTKASPRA